MIPDPIDSIVRVMASDGKVAGTGFLVGPEPYVVTCAHVVTAANPQSNDTVLVQIFRGGQPLTCRVLPQFWRDVRAEDVAILAIQLSAEERARLPRVALGSSSGALTSKLNTFGFPPARGSAGAHGTCVAIGRLTEGGAAALQLQSGEVTFGFSGAPVWDIDAAFVVGMVTSIIPPELDRGGRLRETAFIRTTEVIREICELPLKPGQPYRGLEVFEEAFKDCYFGRDDAIHELIEKLQRNPVVLVTGVSGSGKSSLVRAGLAKGLDRWKPPALSGRLPRVVTPTRTPLTSLLREIVGAFSDVPEALKRAVAAQAPKKAAVGIAVERQLDEVITLADGLHVATAQHPTILIVDQFERLFTTCPDPDVRRQFMDFIRHAANDETRFILCLRLDYYEMAQEHSLFAELGDSQVLLSQMSEDDLTEAIERPAAQFGRYFEPRAVQALINDVKERPGDLPLLEFALSELWQIDNQTGVLTFKSYEGLGYDTPAQKITGAQGAIIKRAEDEWTRLRAADNGILRPENFLKLFLKLVYISQGIGGPALPTSRRAWLSEFDHATQDRAAALSNSFLLTTGRDPVSGEATVEVAHEALIRNWSRLGVSIDQNRGFLAWYSGDFASELQTWIRNKRHSLRAEKLTIAAEWHQRAAAFLEGPAELFISACNRRRFWKRAALISIIVLVLVTLGGYEVAIRRAEIARADDLHERGVRALDEHDFQSAEVLLATSLKIYDNSEVRQHLLDARINGSPLVREIRTKGAAAALSESGKWAVIALEGELVSVQNTENDEVLNTSITHNPSLRYAVSNDGGTLAYSVRTGELRTIALRPRSSSIEWVIGPPADHAGIDSLSFSRNGTSMAVGRFNGRVELRDARTGALKASTVAHRHAVHSVRFHPSQLIIVSGGADRNVQLWDCSKPTATQLGSHEDFVAAVAFSPDGSRIASGGADGAVRVWNSQNKLLVATLPGHIGTVRSVAIATSGTIISGGEDGTVRLWDMAVGGEIAQFDAAGDVAAVASDDNAGRVLAATNGYIRSWDLRRRDEGFTIDGLGPITTVAFNSDGKRVASAGQDGFIALWDLGSGRPTGPQMQIPPKSGAIWSLAFTPDGQHLVSGGEDGRIRLWDLSLGRAQEYLVGHDIDQNDAEPAGDVWTIAIHPSRPIAAFGIAASGESSIVLMDLNSWKEINRIRHLNASVWSLSFSHDGKLMAAVAGDRTISLWDVTNLNSIRLLQQVGVGAEMWGVPFSPDDKIMATGGLDRHVRLWNVPDIKPVGAFPPSADHRGLVQSVDFDPRGEWIATASVDHTVQLWNVRTQEVVSLGGHNRPVWWVEFSRDGQWLVSGGLDHRVVVRNLAAIKRVLKVDPVDLLKEAHRHTCLDLVHNEPKYYDDCKQ